MFTQTIFNCLANITNDILTCRMLHPTVCQNHLFQRQRYILYLSSKLKEINGQKLIVEVFGVALFA